MLNRDELKQLVRSSLSIMFLLQGFILICLVVRQLYLSIPKQVRVTSSELQVITPWFLKHIQPEKGYELFVLFAVSSGLVIGLWILSTLRGIIYFRQFRSTGTMVLMNAIFVFAITFVFFPAPSESLASFFSWQLKRDWIISSAALFVFAMALKWDRVFLIAASLPIFICGLISLKPLSLYNYAYILEPAVRMWDGQSLSSISSQYDLILPLMSLPFVALQFDLNWYKVLLQILSTAFYLWLFVHLFRHVRKEIALLAAFIFVLAKFALNISDASALPQTSFLRLELWFPLFYFAYRYGLGAASTVAYLILIIFLGKTFGIIFAGMYLLVFLVRYFFEKNTNLSLARKRGIVIVVSTSIVLSQILLPNTRLVDYLHFQVSFLEMSTFSFFWLLLPVFLFCAWQIFIAEIPERNKDAYVLLVFLCLGTLPYFLGRSHENNLLHIATPFVFCFAIGLNQIVGRLWMLMPMSVMCSALLVPTLVDCALQRLQALPQTGLSPTVAIARGDFTELRHEAYFSQMEDGRTLPCFPYSSLEFYMHYYQLGNFKKLAARDFVICGTILKDQELFRYQEQLRKRGLQLLILQTSER